MNKNIHKVGAFVLALAMSGAPAVALAENGGSENSVVTQVGVQAQVTAGVRPSVNGAEETDESDNAVASSTKIDERVSEQAREQAKQLAEQVREMTKDRLELELEDDQDRASSIEDLKQKIEIRKQELDDEEASTTPEFRGAMKNANEVRLAVHALLASKDLIGGIGQQVSEIAKEVDHSVASTTNAEAKIQSRGFLFRLFFGGDSTSAEVIAQEASQNQARIDTLTALLGQVNISAEVQATLTAQITALKDAQTRLQALAEKEQKAWGLFSWRF